MSASELKILSENKDVLKRVKCLSFWNTKLANLELLAYFQNVEYLSIAHIAEKNFTFKSIDYLKKLKTLCLLKTGKVQDFTSVPSNKSIENLSLLQPTHIKNMCGLGNLSGLKYLNISGSLDKVYYLEKINELNRLPSLEKIKFYRIHLPFDELITALDLPIAIELEIDGNLYPTAQYKELSLVLKNVSSQMFSPYIDDVDYVIPIDKGKRRIIKTDENYKEKLGILMRNGIITNLVEWSRN